MTEQAPRDDETNTRGEPPEPERPWGETAPANEVLRRFWMAYPDEYAARLATAERNSHDPR